MKRESLKRFLSGLLVSTLTVGSVFTAFATEAKADPAEKDGVEWEELDEVILGEDEVEAEETEVEELEPEYAEDDQVRVFIVFEDDSVVDRGFDPSDITDNKKAIAYSDKLEKAQDEVITDIEDALDGEALDTRYSFTLLTNAVSAEVEYGNIETIAEVDGVEAVYVVPVYEVQAKGEDTQMITAGDMVGSRSTWSNGYTGAGMRVAIVDTGLDSDHPSFDSDAFLYSLDEVAAKADKTVEDYNLLGEDEIASALDKLNASAMYPGLTADDLYRTAKVAYGFNYVDQDLDITHDNDTQGEHGTHVAGITTSNRYVPQEDGSFGPQSAGVVGVAPEAQLMVMKVFGKGGGAYTDDYMAAIEDAIVLGADAVNLSLGSSSAGESTDGEAYVNEIFNKLVDTDTVVSISAGNSGYWAEESQYGGLLPTDVNAATNGSPGSYTNAFTVASAVNCSLTGYAALFNENNSVSYDDGGSANNKPFTSLDTTGNGTEYEYVYIDSVGEAEDFANVDVEGKIAIVNRGAISFYVKHMNAADAGAVGLFVANNTAGTISMSLSGSTATIPCASITQADGLAIKDASTEIAEGVYTGKVSISGNVITVPNTLDGYTMSDFSSWGVPSSLELKPEITAPGGNIYSTVDNGGYASMSGTSMAAPSVTGLSALVIQYIEENDLAAKTGLTKRNLAQSLLMSTATPLVQPDGNLYSPRKQGAGLASALSATTAPAYILVGDKNGNDGKVKFELGDDPKRTGVYNMSFDVYSINGEASYYEFDSTVLTESLDEYGLVANSSYNLDPQVEVTASNEVLVFDVNKDGSVDESDVQALVSYINGSLESELVSANEDRYDVNNNGVVDSSDARELLLSISGKSEAFDLEKKLIEVTDKTTVSVKVTLSDSDREYLDKTFENGMFVEGFLGLDGAIDLSVPFLAFYGNWTDPSMFEPFDFFEWYYSDEDFYTYTGVNYTNYLAYQMAGAAKAVPFVGNMYENDDEYIADRNAMSSLSGDKLSAFYFTLIRNAQRATIEVVDADTNEVYYSAERTDLTGAFFYDSQAEWYNTMTSMPLNWAGTDANGEALADGTKVNVVVTALPEYYKDETKVPGKGASMSVPMTIDNEKPWASYVSNKSDKTMRIIAQDNNYAAAVKVIAKDKKTVLGSYAVNATEAGEGTELTIEYPETVFYLTVIDYAGNKTSYRVNKSGIADTTVPTGLTLSETSTKMMKGSSLELIADVQPISIKESAAKVTWTSSDESVATVDENGIVKAVAVGSAVITATTKNKGADGKPFTAECSVEVFSVDVNLSATLWDEEGAVYFADFNTATLPNYTKVSESQSTPYWSAVDTGNYIIASTYNKTQSASDYYVIDPANGFASEKLFTSYWNTDMALAPTSEELLGTYGNYIVISNLTEGMTGAYDLTKYIGANSLVGITYVGSTVFQGMDMDLYYLVDNTGTLYLFGYVSEVGFICQEMGSCGVSTNGQWYYESLIYDFETGFLFYSVYDKTDEVTVYAIAEDYDSETKESTFEAYSIGKFPANVWPVSGLMVKSLGEVEVETPAAIAGKELCNGYDEITRTFEAPVLKGMN